MKLLNTERSMSYRWLIRARDFGDAVDDYGTKVTIPLAGRIPARRTISALRIHQLCVPLTVWNVVSDNNQVSATIGATTYTATIPVGMYSGDELSDNVASYLTAEMTAVPYVCSVAFDHNTFQTTISIVDGASLPVVFSITSTETASAPGILRLLGFKRDGWGDPNIVTTATFNINVGDNDTITFQNIGITPTPPLAALVIAAGVYTPTSLLAAIKTSFDTNFTAEGLTLNYVFDVDRYGVKLTVFNSSLTEVEFDVESTSGATDSMLEYLGFLTDGTGGEYTGQFFYSSPQSDLSLRTLDYTGATSYVSDGPLNVFMDRMFMVTCEQIVGINTGIDALSRAGWTEGPIGVFPFKGAIGELMYFKTMEDEPWIPLTAKQPITEIVLYLRRDTYSSFGPPMVDWSVVLDLR